MSNELNLNPTKVEMDLGGRTLTLETGKMAKQADGAVLATMGETVVLITAVSNRSLRPGQDFFPLTVNYEEKHYAAGKIPGGFFKREGRAGVEATLSCRIIDRQIRPMFPDGYMFETQIIAMVLAYDGVNDPAVMAASGAGAALHISDIPFNGPTASVSVGRIDGEFVLNPSPEQMEKSDLDLLVAGTADAINMVEGGAEFVKEEDLLNALYFGHDAIKRICALSEELRTKVGIEKRAFEAPQENTDLYNTLSSEFGAEVSAAFALGKQDRTTRLDELKTKALTELTAAIHDEDEKASAEDEIGKYWKKLMSNLMRKSVLDTGKRIDGRKTNEVRPISTEVSVIPKVHGSALFSRGETQVLSVITLGSKVDEQLIDNMQTSGYNSYMLHYNFPPFSTGEARMLRGQSRREIGHGKLAERALRPTLPEKEKFPYTVRVVCEVLESNGSSSMGSVCSGSMALMDCGVPIKGPISGIAMGLIKDGDQVAVLSDILGDEDHLGDMDFKVTGNEAGVTAIQMDLKIKGIDRSIFEKALMQAREGRLHILDRMNSAINNPASDLKPTAPRIETFSIPKDKIRDVIGSGGKVIRSIIETTGAKIDIDDDGTISIASSDSKAMADAKEIIKGISEGPKVGKTYSGPIKRVVDFGAFVELFPGCEGLLHISEVAHDRIKNIHDVLSEGDTVEVKVLEVDRTGRIRLSKKALLEKPEKQD